MNNNNKNTGKSESQNPPSNNNEKWDELDQLAKMMARNLMRLPPEKRGKHREES